MAKVTRKVTSDITWEEVQDIVNRGKEKELLPAGTVIAEELKDGRKVMIRVQDTDVYQDGEVIFGSVGTVGPGHHMNPRMTAKGGWSACDMRRYLNEDILALFPDDLVAVISKTKNVQILDGETVECEDMLFLPSEMEVFGSEEYSESNGIDKQFEAYKDKMNRIALDEDGYLDWWFLNSVASAAAFAYCNSFGYACCLSASSSDGVRPHFAVRKNQ